MQPNSCFCFRLQTVLALFSVMFYNYTLFHHSCSCTDTKRFLQLWKRHQPKRVDIGEVPVILIDFDTQESLFICSSIYASVWKGRLPIVFDKYLSPFSLGTNTHVKACVTRRNNTCLLKELTLITPSHTVRERKEGRETLLFIFGGEPNVSINNVQAQVSVPNTARR